MKSGVETDSWNGRALLTDLYQLTMAYGYWKSGRADREAVFHLFFRKAPFQSGFTIAASLATAIDFLNSYHFSEADLQFLSMMTGNDGQPLFEPGFLDYLRTLKFACDVDAMPEGTVAFAHEPLLRIQGPILQCQLLETALLNLLNFQSLIATKAARVCLATRGEPVMEFGLRRAQGVDGALRASRAAYIGGCAAASNVLAGKRFGIPVRGTHAHSWVMSFDDEREAFLAYAGAMPNNGDYREQRPGRAHHCEPERTGRKGQYLGRGHKADHRLRSAGAGRRLQTRGDSRQGRAMGVQGKIERTGRQDFKPRHPASPAISLGQGIHRRRNLRCRNGGA